MQTYNITILTGINYLSQVLKKNTNVAASENSGESDSQFVCITIMLHPGGPVEHQMGFPFISIAKYIGYRLWLMYFVLIFSFSTFSHQLPSKPSSQSLRLLSTIDRKSHRVSQLSKRHSHDETLLLPQMGVSASSCGLLDDSLCGTSDNLASHRHWRIPKVHIAWSNTNTSTQPSQSPTCVPSEASRILIMLWFRAVVSKV